jgi:c-di-GMP-related signal transduction protein
MEELAPALPLRDEIRQALQGAANPERSLLQWLECHEHGDWALCDVVVEANELNEDQVIRCYVEAVAWAEEVLRSVA